MDEITTPVQESKMHDGMRTIADWLPPRVVEELKKIPDGWAHLTIMEDPKREEKVYFIAGRELMRFRMQSV